MLFGGGLANFKLVADEGKRLDEDLLKTWQEKKQEKGQSAKILLNTGDLKSWDETDYVLGNIQWQRSAILSSLPNYGKSIENDIIFIRKFIDGQ